MVVVVSYGISIGVEQESSLVWWIFGLISLAVEARGGLTLIALFDLTRVLQNRRWVILSWVYVCITFTITILLQLDCCLSCTQQQLGIPLNVFVAADRKPRGRIRVDISSRLRFGLYISGRKEGGLHCLPLGRGREEGCEIDIVYIERERACVCVFVLQQR